MGRFAILEMLEITEDIRKLVIDQKSDFDIFAKARENKFLTMQEDGILKAMQGLTTMEEIYKTV